MDTDTVADTMRFYELTIRATDSAGNAADAACSVGIVHSTSSNRLTGQEIKRGLAEEDLVQVTKALENSTSELYELASLSLKTEVVVSK
jgi:hypothetical protein